MIRNVSELGLKRQYENDDDVRDYIRCLPALAFVPDDDVMDAFEVLAESSPQVDRIDLITTFFEHTYVRGRRQRGRGDNYSPAMYPINLWNKHDDAVDGIARTTNIVEGWHSGLQSLFQWHYPTLCTFLDGIKDIAKQKSVFLQESAGVHQTAAKSYRLLETESHCTTMYNCTCG